MKVNQTASRYGAELISEWPHLFKGLAKRSIKREGAVWNTRVYPPETAGQGSPD